MLYTNIVDDYNKNIGNWTHVTNYYEAVGVNIIYLPQKRLTFKIIGFVQEK